jgi:hypothetical protein
MKLKAQKVGAAETPVQGNNILSLEQDITAVCTTMQKGHRNSSGRGVVAQSQMALRQ